MHKPKVRETRPWGHHLQEVKGTEKMTYNEGSKGHANNRLKGKLLPKYSDFGTFKAIVRRGLFLSAHSNGL